MATALRVFPPIERSPIRILGVVNSEEELPSEGNQHGDGYIINQDLWVWTGAEWENVGALRGPQGDLGPSLRPRGELSHESELPLSNNQQGDIFTVGSHVWGWDGSEWVNLGPFATGVIVHVREDEPPVANVGDLWYDPTGTALPTLTPSSPEFMSLVMSDIAQDGRLDRLDRFADVFDPFNYGTVGAGDDTAAIQAAINAAEAKAATTGERQNVFLSRRQWDIPGTTGVTIDSSRVHIVAQKGATVYAPNIQAGYAPINLRGSRTTEVAVVTQDAEQGAMSITVDNASVLSPGDQIMIRSDETFNPDRPDTHKKGEFADIASINGTTVTLAAPLQDSYNATDYTVTIDIFNPIVDVGVHDLTIIGGSVDDVIGLHAISCQGLDVSGVNVLDKKFAGIQVQISRGVSIKECYAERSNQSGLGYGILVYGSEHVTIKDCGGTNNRHTVDISSGVGQPVPRHITIDHITARRDTSTGISTHGGDHIRIINCDVVGCGGGIINRGRNASIINNTVVGTKGGGQSYIHGILIGDGGAAPWGNGISATGLTIQGNTIDLRGNGLPDCRGIQCNAPLIDAEITNNTIRGHTSHGMYLQGNIIRNTKITWNLLDCSDTTETYHMGIYISPRETVDGSNQIGLDIMYNRILDCSGSCIRLHGNPSSGENASTKIRIKHNDFTGFGNRAVDMIVGYFDLVEIDLGFVDSFTNVLPSFNATRPIVVASGSGSPENVLRGGPGSQYTRVDDGTVYIKATGTGTTGWAQVDPVSINAFRQASEPHILGYYRADSEAFGADPSKSASENESAIKAALTAAGENGTVYIGPGEYEVNQIDLDIDGQRLLLDDKCVLKRPDGGSSRVIQVPAGTTGVTIEGGTIDGNADNSTGEAIMFGSDVHYVTIRNVHFTNTPASCIRSKGTSGPDNTHITIQGCRFTNMGGTGVNFNWETTDSMIIDNYFDMDGSNTNAVWIGNGSKRCRISGNIIHNCNRIGIEVWNRNSEYAVVSDNILYLADVDPSMGISLEGDYAIAANNQIICPTPSDKNRNGIELVVGVGQKAIGNTLIGCRFSVDSVKEAIIVGNRITENYGYAMELVDGGSTGVVGPPEDIIIRDNVFSNNLSRAIMVQNGVKRISIIGNHFINNATHDIFLNNDVSYYVIANNIFHVGDKSGDAIWGGTNPSGVMMGNIRIGNNAFNVRPDLPIRSNVYYNSSNTRIAQSGQTGGIVRFSINPANQEYQPGRNYLATTNGAVSTASARFTANGNGGAQILPLEWTIPPKVGDVEPGLVFVFNTGEEVEIRNDDTSNPLTGTWESDRKDIYGSTNRGGIVYMHLIAHNTGDEATTQDIDAIEFFGQAI